MEILETTSILNLLRKAATWISITVLSTNLLAQPLNDCPGMGVTNGAWNDAWIPGIGTWDVYSGVPIESTPIQQWVANRHAIKSAADGINPDIVVEDLPYIPPGSNINYVIQLGNNLDEAPNGYGYYERLTTSFLVDSTNSMLQIWFAVILQKPNHVAVRQPKFRFKVFDQNQNLLPCGDYEVIAYGNIPGFKYQDYHDLVYRTWTTASIDLRDRIGETVTIEFSTYDCADGGHYGYALFAVECLRAEITTEQFFCPGVDSTITLKAPDGFQDYVWSNGSIGQIATFLNPQGGETVSVKFKPFSSLEDDCELTLDYQIPLSVDIIVPATLTFCETSNSTINALGPTGCTYLWSTGANTPSISVNQPGIYHITVTKETCHLQDSVEVFQVDLPRVDMNASQPSCYGEGNGSICTILQQPGTTVTYQWSNGGANACIDNLFKGNYSLTVTESQLGCTFTQSLFLDEPLFLAAETEMTASPGCDNRDEGELHISVNGGTEPYQIKWSNSEEGETAVIQQAGKYTVSVTDANLCVTTDSIEVMQLLFNSEKGDNYCYQGSKGWIKIGAESGVAPYQYNIDSGPFGAITEFNELKSGTYIVAVQDASGCIILDTIAILEKRIAPYEILFIPSDTSVELGQTLYFELLTNFPTEEETVHWDSPFDLDCIDCFDPSGKPENDCIVQVWAEDIYGCSDTTQMWVQVDKNYHFQAPNIFWPEGAQRDENQVWSISLDEEQVRSVLYLRVFSRWGETVYEYSDLQPDDINAFWDGTFKGKLMEAGVYVWQARIRFIDGIEKDYSGDVTLWRGYRR